MKKTVLSILFLVLFAVSAGGAGAADVKIEGPAGRHIRVSNPYENIWNYTENGKTYTLEEEINGKLIFKKGYKTLSKGKFRGNKLSMKTDTGDMFMTLKIRPDKIKLSWDSNGSEWEFKFRSGKIKVTSDGMEYGKVKYYSELGKVKAKDLLGQVAAEIKNQKKLKAPAGAFVLTNIPVEKQAFVTLLLFLLDR